MDDFADQKIQEFADAGRAAVEAVFSLLRHVNLRQAAIERRQHDFESRINMTLKEQQAAMDTAITSMKAAASDVSDSADTVAASADKVVAIAESANAKIAELAAENDVDFTSETAEIGAVQTSLEAAKAKIAGATAKLDAIPPIAPVPDPVPDPNPTPDTSPDLGSFTG